MLVLGPTPIQIPVMHGAALPVCMSYEVLSPWTCNGLNMYDTIMSYLMSHGENLSYITKPFTLNGTSLANVHRNQFYCLKF